MLATAAVVATMCVLYAGYATVTRPFLRSQVSRPVNQKLPPLPVPAELQELTTGVLKWNGTPSYSIGTDDSNTKLVFDKWEKIGDPELGVVELRPFAFVTTDPERPDAEPFVLQCESARIRFDAFDLFKQKIGKILGGELFGQVQMTGPDGLVMTGRSFVLDDRNLFSDWPVTFRFGPSTEPGDDRIRIDGRADGVVLEFHTAGPGESGLLGRELPPITGLKSIWLRQNVQLDILSDESEPGNLKKPEHVVITCDGNARYTIDDRVAMFSKNVRVAHSQSAQGTGIALPGMLHSLDNCETLTFKLQDNGRENAASLANFSLALELRSIEAKGTQLRLQSLADDLIAVGGRLFYDLIKHEAVLAGGPLDPTAAPPLVAVALNEQQLHCPLVTIRTTDDNRLVKATFPGPGVLRTAPEASQGRRSIPAVQANWDKEVIIEPVLSDAGLPQMRINADGNVRIRMADEDVRVTAPQLTCWVDERQSQSYGEQASSSARNPLRRILARQGARIVRPDLDLNADQLLELNLIPIDRVASPIQQVASEQNDTRNSSTKETTQKQPMTAHAKSIGVTLGIAENDVELLGLTAETGVHLEQAGATDRDPPRFKVTTDRATLSGRGDEQRLSLTGGPSELSIDGMTIAAVQLVADRKANGIQIPGGGVITIPMTGDMGGALNGAIPQNALNANTTPPAAVKQSGNQQTGNNADEPLTVTWAERLEFHGDTVSFFGDVIAKHGDTEARGDQLDVKLSREVDFSTLSRESVRAFRSQPLDLVSLTFRHNVIVSSKEWEGTSLKALRTASMATLSFDRTTQQLHGLGPGVIRQWTLEPPKADANRSSTRTANLPYRMTQVTFVGDVTGHSERRWLRLSRSVKALSGMVGRPLEELTRDNLLESSDQPLDVFWLGCNTLEVSIDPLAPTGEANAQNVAIQATGRVEVEGKEFRAIADRASVDRRTGLITIHGDGGNHASFWWQKVAGAAANAVRAREFRVNQEAHTFVVDEAVGFWGGR